MDKHSRPDASEKSHYCTIFVHYNDSKVGALIDEKIREISRSVIQFYTNTITSFPPPSRRRVYAHNRPRTNSFVTESAGRRLGIPYNAYEGNECTFQTPSVSLGQAVTPSVPYRTGWDPLPG